MYVQKYYFEKFLAVKNGENSENQAKYDLTLTGHISAIFQLF